MAFKQVCNSLFVVLACCNILSMANPLSYLRDNDQSGLPFQNQGLVYLNDNGVNQAASVVPLQTAPVNVINNIGSSPLQTIAAYPNTISNVGFVGGNVLGSTFVNTGLSAVQYPTVAQTVPVTQFVNNPSLIQPVGQYAVQQPTFVGGSVGNPNQITNNQVVPVEVNFNSNPGYYI